MWKEEYKKLMFSEHTTEDSTLEGFKLKHLNVPQSLYKYRAINQYSLDNLRNDTVRFSKATDFNDPYDSALTISEKEEFDQPNKFGLLKSFAERFDVDLEELKPVFEDLDYEKTLQLFLYYYSPYKDSPELVPGIVKEVLTETKELYEGYVASISSLHQEMVYASCFSEEPASMLMWSHYSCDHTGMCIEYDLINLAIEDEALWGLHPVFYIDNLLNLNDFSDEVRKNMSPTILASINKSLEWSYEQEWRIIFLKGQEAKPFNYKVGIPKSIILGAKVSEADKDEVLKIAEEKNIPLKQVQLDRSKYGLTVVDY